MKLAIPALILLAASCGEYKVSDGASVDRVGEIRALTPTDVTTNERANIVAVCNALGIKRSILPTALNSRHTFSTSQTDCEGNAVGSGSVEVIIQSGLSGFTYKRSADGGEFIFPTIETDESGVLSDLCNAVSNLTNPVVGDSEITFFNTTAVSSNDCRSVPGEICVKLEKASLQGDQAVIHTKEWLRVRVNSPDGKYIGFVTDRKKVTRSYCGINEVLSFKSTLQIK